MLGGYLKPLRKVPTIIEMEYKKTKLFEKELVLDA
jgi:hypothetical protein